MSEAVPFLILAQTCVGAWMDFFIKTPGDGFERRQFLRRWRKGWEEEGCHDYQHFRDEYGNGVWVLRGQVSQAAGQLFTKTRKVSRKRRLP